MPTKQEIKTIKQLAKQGKSVNHIKNKLELPKSTVYYHFKKEVGQKQKENQLQIPEDEEVKGEICGIFAGDGNFYKRKEGHYRVQFFLNYKEDYWKDLKKFLSEKLSKNPMVFHDVKGSVTTLRYNSRELYELLKQYLSWEEDKTSTISLRDQKISKDFKIGFVRGLIDTDGYREKKFRRYIYGTVSKDLRDDFSRILADLHINHKNYREEPVKKHWKVMHKTRITGDAADKFNTLVNPRNSKKQYKIDGAGETTTN